MKRLFFLFICILLIGCSSSRDISYTRVSNNSYSDNLALSPVNHLQLVVNNLNMLVIYALANKKENKDHDADIIQNYMRFQLTDSNKLALHLFYKSTVKKLTQDKCKELLAKEGDRSKFYDMVSTMLSTVSYYRFSDGDAKNFFMDSIIYIHMHAKENSELSISCNE